MLPDSRGLPDLYCRVSTVHNIMLLALLLTQNFSCSLSEEKADGMSFQSHTEYKIIGDYKQAIYHQQLFPEDIVTLQPRQTAEHKLFFYLSKKKRASSGSLSGD